VDAERQRGGAGAVVGIEEVHSAPGGVKLLV
jgi:hypothetical protein